jgi:ketosteroid isomerase-like protein
MIISTHPPALEPNDIARFFVERVNQGDLDGLVALYESDAVLALPDGSIAKGSAEIRTFYDRLLRSQPQFAPGEQQPALCNGNVAITSSRLTNGTVTVEIARRQAAGFWLWSVDQPQAATTS